MYAYFSDGFITPVQGVIESVRGLHITEEKLSWADKLMLKMLTGLLAVMAQSFQEFELEGDIDTTKMREEYEFGFSFYRLLDKNIEQLLNVLPANNELVVKFKQQADQTLEAYADVLETFEILSSTEVVTKLDAIERGDLADFMTTKEFLNGLAD